MATPTRPPNSQTQIGRSISTSLSAEESTVESAVSLASELAGAGIGAGIGAGVGWLARRPPRWRRVDDPRDPVRHRHPVDRAELSLRADEHRAVLVDGDALSLLLGRQLELADSLKAGVGVDDRAAVVAQHEVLPVWEERSVGGEPEHVADRFEQVWPGGAQPLRRRVEHPTQQLLGDHKHLAADRVHEQRLRVVGTVAVGQRVRRRLDLLRGPPRGDSEQRHRLPRGGVVADVADEQVAVRHRGDRLDIDRVSGPRGPTDGAAGDRIDDEGPPGVAGVVHRHEQSVARHQTARLDDLRVVEAELGPGTLGAGHGRADRERHSHRDGGEGLRDAAHERSASSSARRGRMPQVATSSSYSLRTPPPFTGPLVRTARNIVLRGVCSLATNSITSTR